jgi:hypothetical protein
MAHPATNGICGIKRLIAMAVPMTSAMSVAMICPMSAISLKNPQTRTYGSFSHDVQKYVQPPWEEGLACFSKVKSTDTSKFDAQTLEENGKEIRHQNDEEELEPVGNSGSNICCIVSWIDVCR